MGPAGQLGKIIATFLPEPADIVARIDYQVGPRPSVKPLQNQAQGLDAPVREGRNPERIRRSLRRRQGPEPGQAAPTLSGP